MKLKKTTLTLCSIALLLGAAALPASASSLTWDFFTLTGSPAAPGYSLGTTHTTFTQSGESLTLWSYTSSGCTGGASWCAGTGDLYSRNLGTADEQGLGLTNDHYPYDEISYPNGIYVNLANSGRASDVMLGSVQGTSTSGETWAIWGSNNGSTWTELGHGMGGGVVNFNDSSLLSGYGQLIITDPSLTPYLNSNDILLASITTDGVPEPGTLALFGAGLLGCALLIARRRARQH